jgi:hypothetical protein
LGIEILKRRQILDNFVTEDQAIFAALRRRSGVYRVTTGAADSNHWPFVMQHQLDHIAPRVDTIILYPLLSIERHPHSAHGADDLNTCVRYILDLPWSPAAARSHSR